MVHRQRDAQKRIEYCILRRQRVHVYYIDRASVERHISLEGKGA
jgi:hypothetical protein